MKKLILGFFVLGALSFGLQSCGEDDPCDDCTADQECNDGVCEDIVMGCQICGNYAGDATGNVLVPGGILDTVFTADDPLALPAVVSETATEGTYSLAVDLSGLTPILTDPVTVEGTYDESTKMLTIDDEYEYVGLFIGVAGTVDFSTDDAISGSLTLADGPSGTPVGIQGELNFTGVKQ